MHAHPQARIWGAPLIASHVGADVAADLVAIGLDPTDDGVSMLVDVGTNTEVVIAARGRILAASCPAGPAFEGGEVTYGMQAADGAIESLTIDVDGRIEYRTIGGAEPAGTLRLRADRPRRRAATHGSDDPERRVRGAGAARRGRA